MATCSDCNGSGSVLATYDCSRCNGSGELTTYDYRGQERRTKCPDCDGGHVYVEEQCDTCQGTGIE
jgi:DnaJ-class molecular chaperone